MSGISIIIVNYNVQYFLRQCIQSIYRSDYAGPLQVIVVDNCSVDDSVIMVQEEFPQVDLIVSKDNLGFSKGNNLAIDRIKHPFTLILNPDTIVGEDTLSQVATTLTSRQQIGAIGVRMVDGAGRYLPESKRGFPTPLHAIFKMSGLSKLFPKSKLLNAYYQGHLPEMSSNEVEVLTGAFAFIRTDLFKDIGGFDEDYFMYGEDIELSYQIKERDYGILYFPETTIVHFKGESTKKLSTSYLKNFYGAMSIYAGKRNTGASFLWKLLLNVGIVFSGIIGFTKKITIGFIRPALDVFILIVSAFGIQKIWAVYAYDNVHYYKNASFGLVFMCLILLGVFCYYLLGQYDKRHNIKHLFYGFVFSSFSMLSLYSLLPSELRVSRSILILLALITPFVLYVSRRLFNVLNEGTSAFDSMEGKRVAIIGSDHSTADIKKIVTRFSGEGSLVGTVGVTSDGSLGRVTDLESIVASRSINELIFCSRDIKINEIFKKMASLGPRVSYKVANNDNSSILGSASKERVGEWYTTEVAYKIAEPFHRRTKRLVDLALSITYTLLFPIILLFSPKRQLIFSNLPSVFFGRKTWLGYDRKDDQINKLPKLKSGVFQVGSQAGGNRDPHQENLRYARNYSTWSELVAILEKLFRKEN